VRGRLPGLCIKEGIATSDRLTVREHVAGSAGLGAAWLLVLLGPLGWLILLAIAFTHRPAEYVSVTVPFSEFAYRRLSVTRRMRRIWLGLAVAAAVLALAALSMASLTSVVAAWVLGLFAVAALVSAVLEGRRLTHAGIGVSLDASRRWLSLSGVHPDFARAAAAQRDRVDEAPGR
jgi:hypothetical protein